MNTKELKKALIETGRWNDEANIQVSSETSSERIYQVSAPIASSFKAVQLSMLHHRFGTNHRRSYAALNWLRNKDEAFSQIAFDLLHLNSCGREVLLRPYLENSIRGKQLLSSKTGVLNISRTLGQVALRLSHFKAQTHGHIPTPTGFLPIEPTLGQEMLYRARQHHQIAVAYNADLGKRSLELLDFIEEHHLSRMPNTSLVHGELAPHQLVFSGEDTDFPIQILGWHNAFFGDPIQNWAHVLFSKDSILNAFVQGFGVGQLHRELNENGSIRLRLSLAQIILKRITMLTHYQDQYFSHRHNECANMAKNVLEPDWAMARLMGAMKGEKELSSPDSMASKPSPTAALRRLALYPRLSPNEAVVLCGGLSAEILGLPRLAQPLLHEISQTGKNYPLCNTNECSTDWETVSQELLGLYTDVETDSYQSLTLYWIARTVMEQEHCSPLPKSCLFGLSECLRVLVLSDRSLSHQWRQGNKKSRSIQLLFNGIQSLAAAHAMIAWAQNDVATTQAWKKVARNLERKVRAAAGHLELTLMLLQGFSTDTDSARCRLAEKSKLVGLEKALPTLVYSLEWLNERVEPMAPTDVFFEIAKPT